MRIYKVSASALRVRIEVVLSAVEGVVRVRLCRVGVKRPRQETQAEQYSDTVPSQMLLLYSVSLRILQGCHSKHKHRSAVKDRLRIPQGSFEATLQDIV